MGVNEAQAKITARGLCEIMRKLDILKLDMDRDTREPIKLWIDLLRYYSKQGAS